MFMLKRIIIIALIVLLPFIFWYATQFGALQSVPFATAMKMSEQASDVEQAQKVKIDGFYTVKEDGHDHEGHEGHLYAKDLQGTIFKVEYTGKDPLPDMKEGSEISVFGHVHGGDEPYVHASQVILR
jgi:hypothetical protein